MSATVKPSRPAYDLSYVYRERTVTSGLPELAVVTLQVPAETFDGKPVAAGSVGTIVMVHGEGEVYDIEFDTPVGVASVAAGDVVLVED